MRCPKCQYISFDSGDRCRNCGYEFSLAVDVASLDLPIQTGDEAIGPLGDLALSDLDAPLDPGAGREATPGYTPLNGGFPARGPAPAPRSPTPVRMQPAPAGEARQPDTDPAELPLFHAGGFDDRPLVTPPAIPRAPLSVRRSGPLMPRTQSRPSADEPELDLEMPPAPLRGEASRSVAAETAAAGSDVAAGAPAGSAAQAGRRILAAVVDVLLLGSIDAGVVYFTLQLVGFEPAEILLLPRVPLLGFLLLLNGGYFVAFTAAAGQTIGKMLAGIKVVPADLDSPSDRVPLGHAALRTVAYLVSVLPAGLGYLPALISKDRRAIHDRLADTRVVQA